MGQSVLNSLGQLKGAASLLDSGTGTAVASTSSETSYVSYAVPGGLLGTTKAIQCFVWGDFLKNSAAGVTLQVKLKYGATTMVDTVANQLAAGVQSANRYPFFQVASVANYNSTAVQNASLFQDISWRSAGADSGQDIFSPSSHWAGSKNGSATEDSTATKTFALSLTWSAASASNEWKPFHYAIYLV